MEKCLLIVNADEKVLEGRTAFLARRLEQLVAEGEFRLVIAAKTIPKPGSSIQLLSGSEGEETGDILPAVKAAAHHVVASAGYSKANDRLVKILRDAGAGEVFIAGLDTEKHVLQTAADLFEKGFAPRVLTHYCVSTAGPQMHRVGLIVLGRLIGRENLVKGRHPSDRAEGAEDTAA
ncbi:MAG: isochorismatase family protein [Firmicutes bacterium]|nr:isochorismatase family protein [Bacillota bacterium]